MKCRDCGKFIAYIKDPENLESGRDYAWDGEPISDWYAHKY